MAQLFGVCIDDDARTLVIVMELMARGDLRSALSDSHDGIYRSSTPHMTAGAGPIACSSDPEKQAIAAPRHAAAAQQLKKRLLMRHALHPCARECATSALLSAQVGAERQTHRAGHRPRAAGAAQRERDPQVTDRQHCMATQHPCAVRAFEVGNASLLSLLRRSSQPPQLAVLAKLTSLRAAFMPCTAFRSDLRSSNVLLAADGTAKLGDVGLAALAASVSSAGSSEAAFPYSAPELLMGALCTEKVGKQLLVFYWDECRFMVIFISAYIHLYNTF